ncbi:hypothetical protein P0082_08250 [Candidatus Haliotispira prima]|uniref:Uncharacterized protein n=1 Tax=Candidatus Haliotispira prima TaxID=3034016 RepID=A0ABY8MI42_9SPIO|nr:hypothetical protein P0082_08250 [Candidatus Haliotispira prima]
MAWVSMREGLVQFDNGTQGVKTIGVIVSRETEHPAYADAKDLPGFYTRKTKADGTPRTVCLSMTDKMTATKLNTLVTVSVDGQATDFASAIAAAPELLHPNTGYYAHFYEITGTAGTTDTTGTAIEKPAFTTEDFPTTFPTVRGLYSRFYNQITATSTSPNMEYKSSESYLIPIRFHYFPASVGVYALRNGTNTFQLPESSQNMRPFTTTSPTILVYDLYNITPSGPGTNVALWDGMVNFNSISRPSGIDYIHGGEHFAYYDNKKTVAVTE